MDDLELYFVGDGPKCLIWNYDIFGFDSGRTRQTADLFAEAGYLVIIPDFYRGTHREPTAPDVFTWMKEVTDWSKLKRAFEDIVMPFAKNKGHYNACLNICIFLCFPNRCQGVRSHRYVLGQLHGTERMCLSGGLYKNKIR